MTATRVARFAGRLVVTIDGTQIPLLDTPANLPVFPKVKAGPNGPARYPMLRLVGPVACGTRTLVDAVFGIELIYAQDLVKADALRPGMLLPGDRNLSATRFITTVADTDFLIRAKTHSTAFKLPTLRRLPDEAPAIALVRLYHER